MDYKELRDEVSKFCFDNGLVPDFLDEASDERYVMAVSWKNALRSDGILYKGRGPVVMGSSDDIEKWKLSVKEHDAEYFVKRNVAAGGVIDPNDVFMSLDDAVKVEVMLHESYHNTNKMENGKEVVCLSDDKYEEASAFMAGHAGAIEFFDHIGDDDNVLQAMMNYKNKMGFVKLVNMMYEGVEKALKCPDFYDGVNVKDELLSLARQSFPEANMAWLMYYRRFFEKVSEMKEKVKGSRDFKEIVSRLRNIE